MFNNNNEIQTYTMSKALELYKQGYEVFIAHPLEEDADEKMHSEAQIIEGDGYLFVIKIQASDQVEHFLFGGVQS